jgi:hypothetical protein
MLVCKVCMQVQYVIRSPVYLSAHVVECVWSGSVGDVKMYDRTDEWYEKRVVCKRYVAT